MKFKSQGKDVEVTANSKEENFKDFCMDFVQEFGFRDNYTVEWHQRNVLTLYIVTNVYS